MTIFDLCRCCSKWAMYILKLSLVPLPGAITTEHIHHANAEKVTYENGSYARADSRTKKQKKKEKKSRQPSVILLNTLRVVCDCYCEFRLRVFTRKKTRCSRRRSFAADLTYAWYTGCSQTGAREMKRSSQDFLVGLVTQRRIFAKSERDRLPGITLLQNTDAN